MGAIGIDPMHLLSIQGISLGAHVVENKPIN